MIWLFLIVFVLILLFIDLSVLHKKGEIINNKRAAFETLLWVLVASAFSLFIYYGYQNNWINNPTNLTAEKAVIKYITGYLIELSLSIDNLFVIVMIFSSFKIPMKFQHRALFWGILGAIILRGITIALGVTLINKVSWITYIFGLFLLYTAFKMLAKDDDNKPSKLSTYINKLFKINPELNEDKFWVVKNGIKMATPLFGALVLIELTDLIFALDSIPAILAITSDPFLVFSSNIFAVLGLRSMYFFLANMLERFIYLKYSVFAILIFVSIKLIVIHFFEFPEWFSLTFIFVSLVMGILISLKRKSVESEE